MSKCKIMAYSINYIYSNILTDQSCCILSTNSILTYRPTKFVRKNHVKKIYFDLYLVNLNVSGGEYHVYIARREQRNWPDITDNYYVQHINSLTPDADKLWPQLFGNCRQLFPNVLNGEVINNKQVIIITTWCYLLPEGRIVVFYPNVVFSGVVEDASGYYTLASESRQRVDHNVYDVIRT